MQRNNIFTFFENIMNKEKSKIWKIIRKKKLKVLHSWINNEKFTVFICTHIYTLNNDEHEKFVKYSEQLKMLSTYSHTIMFSSTKRAYIFFKHHLHPYMQWNLLELFACSSA